MDLQIRVYFNLCRVILALAVNINGDLYNNLDFELVALVEDACILDSKLVIADDNTVPLNDMLRNSWFLLNLAFFQFFFFLFVLGLLLHCISWQVELDADLVLNAEVILDNLPKLLDLLRGGDLNCVLFSSLLRSCLDHLVSFFSLRVLRVQIIQAPYSVDDWYFGFGALFSWATPF